MLFAGIVLSAADLAVPEIGIWSARIRLAEDAALSIGSRGRLELGGLVLEGTVVEGAVHVGFADYFVVGGAGGWRTRVRERGYRADGGVRLSAVVGDLAAEVGERVEVGSDRAVGYAWTRAAGVASDALELAAPSWYVREDGATVIGARPAGEVEVPLTVQSFDPARRTAVLGLDDEDLGAIVPGLTITADGVEELRIEHVRLVATPGRVFVEVGPHPERRLIDAVMGRLLARMRYYAPYPYRVDSQTASRLTLRAEPITRRDGLPELVEIDKSHGLAGASEECAANSVVLVQWQGGDPGAPYVADYLTSTPTKISLVASSSVRIGDSEHKRVAREGDSVRVDPALSPSPAVPGGGLLFNPNTQTIQVVPPNTPAAVYFSAAIISGSDLLSTK